MHNHALPIENKGCFWVCFHHSWWKPLAFKNP